MAFEAHSLGKSGVSNLVGKIKPICRGSGLPLLRLNLKKKQKGKRHSNTIIQQYLDDYNKH
jgi:hypothetical protein